jgi:hypothetical protein
MAVNHLFFHTFIKPQVTLSHFHALILEAEIKELRKRYRSKALEV